MFDSNILSFYQQEEFRKYPEDEQRAIIGNYFDRIVAPSLPASDEEKSVARTNFMEAHMLPRGVDPRALNLYADQKFVEKSPEEKADILGAFYDKLAGKSAQYLDQEVREQQRELFVAQNMLLPDDKGGWGSALIDAAKNLPHGVETTLRQAGRQIAVHSDDIPDIESISDLEDIRQNPEEYAERFNRERTKGTISADPNDSTNKAVREKQMRDEVYRAKYGHLENPVGDWLPLDPSGAQASAPYSATGALIGGLSLMGSAAAMPVAGIGNVILGASSKDQFLVDKLNQVNEFSRKFRGRPLDQEETDAVVAEYNLMGNQYGGIEALTELGSDFVFNRIAGRIFGKNAVKGALNKLGGFGLDAAGQHTGETIAQYTQGNIEHEAGLSDKRYSGGEGILQAFKEQAGTTNLMLGMTHGPVAAAEYTRSKFFSADKPVLDSSPSQVPRTEEEKGGKLDLLGLNPNDTPKTPSHADQASSPTTQQKAPEQEQTIDNEFFPAPGMGLSPTPPSQTQSPSNEAAPIAFGLGTPASPAEQPVVSEPGTARPQVGQNGLGLFPEAPQPAAQDSAPQPMQEPPIASPIPEAPAVPQAPVVDVSQMMDAPVSAPAPTASADQVAAASTMMPEQSDVNTAAEQTPSSEERRYGSAEAPDTVALGGYFKEQLESGRQYGDIREARKEADALLGGVPAERKSTIVKDVDESVELGVTAAARDIVNDGKDAVDTFRGLVDLYHRQPNLSSRTSTSVANQQYSTPAPLAYLASQLAGIDKTKTVYEPTAGNGMLLIGADAKKSTVNELDANRASRLRAQDFDVTEHDATDYTPGKQYDAVIANPPFGTVKDDAGNKRVWEVSGHETAEIDQAIALKALQSMKPDGKAVLILGGKKGSEAGRRAKYNTATQRSFYKALYDNYKVADHFSVDGRLYARQGASFPIDIIVVDGKGKTEGRPFPAANLPRVYKTFDSLEELLNGGKQEVRQGVDTERGVLGSGDSDAGRRDGDQGSAAPVLASGGLAGGAASSEQRSGGGRAQSGERTSEAGHVQPGTELAETGGGRPAGPSDTGGSGQRVPRASVGQDGSERQEVAVADGKERGSAQVPDDGSKPADMARGAGSAVRARVVEEAPASAEDRKKPPVKQDVHKEDAAPKQEAAPSSTPKPKKQPTVTKGTDLQDVYQPASQSASLGTLIPKNMAAPIRDALENLREKHGDIDAFVAKELGYKDAAELAGRFAGEQVDAIALAIDNMSRGAGFITGDQTGIGKGRVNAAIIRWAKRNGKTPVFVTMKPELYADMIRDLNDIGETGFNPLPTNKLRGKKAIALPDGGKLESPSNLDKVISKAISQGKLEGFDGIFTTYSQLAPSNGKDSPRRELLRSLNENTVLTALSNWQMTVAVTNAQRQITIPFSKLARNISELESGKVVVAPSGLTEKQMETAFDSAQNEVREKRWIATGNLLAAAEKLKTGKIITFDDAQGSRRMGILLNKGVDAKELVSELDVKFPAADDALRFFERTGGNGMVKTSDKLLRISRMSPYGDTYRIAVPAAKATGGKYYLNTGLLSAIGQDFVKAGRDMVARHIDEEQLRAAMNALQKQGYSLVADNFRTEARDVTGTAIEVQKVDLTRASLKDGGKDVVGYVSPEIASTLRLNKPGEIMLDEERVQHIEQRHGKEIRAAGFADAEAFVNHVLKNIDAVYQADSNRKYDLIAVQPATWKRVVIRLEFDSRGDFYRVITAGPLRDDFYKNKTPLWERAQSFHSENSEPMGNPRAFTGQSGVSQDANASDRENIDSSRASVNDSFMDLAGKRPPHRARVRSQAVERTVSALNDAAKNATQTEVVQRFEDLPEHIRQQYKGRESVFEGGYDTGTGKIWFVAANINSLDRVSEIWMHEQVGHHGMHSLLTPQERKQLTNQLWAQLGGMGNEGIRDIAERYDLNPRLNAADRETVIEEYVSKRAEKKNAGELSKADVPLWKRIVSAVRRMLARTMRRITGRELNLGDERVDALLSRLGQHVFNGTGKPADVNTATDKPTVRASLAEEHVREELRSGKGLLSAIKQMRKLRLANDEDISLLQKTARPTQFLAKDHPEVQQLLDIQLDREETRSQKVEEAMKGVYDGLKNLSKTQSKNLTALIHKLDGKTLNAVTEDKFEKRTLPDGDWEYGLNDAHYEQLRDFLTQHNTFKGVNGENVSLDGKTVDVFITIRRMLDNSQLGLYNHLRESKLPKNVIDTYRSSMGSVHNYFPHVRFGDHFIRVLDEEGNVLERRHFFGTKLTADAKAAKILEELKAKYGDSIKDVEYGKLQDLSEDVFEFPMRTADMEKVLQEALNSTGIDGDIKKKLLRAMEQQVSDLFKARGFGQHMMRRNNIAGYEMEDIGKVLFTYCSGQYGWLTKMDAAMKFGETLAKVDAKKKPRLYAWAKNYVMDMLRNADRLDALVDTAKNLMFLNFLGGNFKTAAVNLTQNLITGYPRLGVELGFKHAATSFIHDAGKALCHQISDGKAKSITPEEKAFLQDFYDRGITRDNFMREMMGDLTGGRMSYAWRQFSRVMAWPMSAAERFNRTSLALAAYRAARAGKVVNTETLERFGYQKGQKFDEQSARDFAAGLVTDSHYLYGKANRPEIFRHGDVGKVASSFYTFRSFTHNTLEFWRTLFKMGWRGKAAVGISLGMTATLGGLVSVPLWGTAMTVWRQLFSDGDDPERKLYNWAYKNGGKNAADVLFYGMPSMAGVTISGSLGMELPILQDLKGDKPWGRQILSSGMEIFGVPVAMLEKIGNTFEFAGKGDYWRATEEALPTAASNIMKAIRLADEGMTTRSGKPIADGTGRPIKLSKSESVAKALGFQPVRQSKAFDAHKGQSDVEAFKKNKQDELVTRYLKAFRAKDMAAKEEVLRDWRDYNNKMIREDKRHLVIKPLYPLAMQRMKPNKPQASMRGYARETMQLQ